MKEISLKRVVNIVPINIIAKAKTVIVHKQEIFPGVYVRNTVGVQRRCISVPLLNLTHQNMPLQKNLQTKFSNFNHYTVYEVVGRQTLPETSQKTRKEYRLNNSTFQC